MLTVGQLAARSGLSRSALLYYDSIGLLRPSDRSPAGYRLYSEADVDRLDRILLYRRAGLALSDIAAILESGRDVLTERLSERLSALNDEIADLRRQQALIAQLLPGRSRSRHVRTLDKQGWVAILAATGLSERDMRQWHVEFERLSPEAHQDFLESLGIDDKEIARIRREAARRV